MRLFLAVMFVFATNIPKSFSGDAIPENRKGIIYESAVLEGRELLDTLGYLIGQHKLLERIRSDFPELALEPVAKFNRPLPIF